MTDRSTPWAIVALLSATATAGYICRVNASTAGLLIMKEFALSQPAMGRIFSAFLFGYALFQIPGGALADRQGARRTLLLAAWLWVAVTAAQALVGWGPLTGSTLSAMSLLLFLRFLMGIVAAPTYPAAAQGVSRWVAPAYRGRANGIVIASIGLGSAIASPLVSATMVRWGWRSALLVSALPALAAALIWLKVSEPLGLPVNPPARKPEAPTRDPRLKSSLRTPAFAFLTASYTLQGYVGYIFVFWFYLYLVQERHFDLLSGAWVNSMSWVLSIVSIPLGGFVSDRLASGPLGQIWGSRAVPMAGMAASGVLISIGAHTQSPVTAAIALALATACVLSVEGPFWAMMIRLAGPGSGTAGGIMNMGCNLGGLISPALTPLLASYIGWENALHLAAGFAIVAAALWLRIK